MPQVTQEVCSPNGCGQGCPLVKYFPESNYVPPKYGAGLRLVIAEAPGEQENVQREPLVGGSGRLFDSMCRKAGLKRDDLTLFNVLPVRPPNNVFPTDSAARGYISEEAARAIVAHSVLYHLLPLLEARPWELVTPLGDKALFWLTGHSGIHTWRGSPIIIDTEEINRRVGGPG